MLLMILVVAYTVSSSVPLVLGCLLVEVPRGITDRDFRHAYDVIIGAQNQTRLLEKIREIKLQATVAVAS